MEVFHESNSTESRTDGQIALLIFPSDLQVSTTTIRNKPIKTDSSGVTKISKATRDIIENCIFILFFLSLLLICVVILKRTFKRKKSHVSKVSFTRSRHRNGSGAWRDTKDIGSSKLWNVQDLEYYYAEPRRILWESYYGHSVSHPPHSLTITPLTTTAHLDRELKTFGLFHETTRSPPPKYKEVLFGVDENRRVSLLELPTYSEATQTHFPSNSIHETEDS